MSFTTCASANIAIMSQDAKSDILATAHGSGLIQAHQRHCKVYMHVVFAAGLDREHLCLATSTARHFAFNQPVETISPPPGLHTNRSLLLPTPLIVTGPFPLRPRNLGQIRVDCPRERRASSIAHADANDVQDRDGDQEFDGR